MTNLNYQEKIPNNVDLSTDLSSADMDSLKDLKNEELILEFSKAA